MASDCSFQCFSYKSFVNLSLKWRGGGGGRGSPTGTSPKSVHGSMVVNNYKTKTVPQFCGNFSFLSPTCCHFSCISVIRGVFMAIQNGT